MRRQSKHLAGFLTAMGLAVMSAGTAHAAGGPCGGDVTDQGTIGGGGVYIDPFQTSGTTVTGSLTITRLAATSGGGKTQDYAFYMVPESTLPTGSTVTYNGVNILNTTGTPSLPAPSASNLNLSGGTIQAYSGSSPSGYLVVGFSGASQTDVETINNLQFTLGSLGYLPAGPTTVYFDVYYVCKATGGYTSVTTPTAGPAQAMALTVNTLSALQVSAVGTALDFGPIGQTTSGGTAATQLGSAIRVASNGPYSVALSSAQNFLMTYTGGNTSSPDNTNVKYNISLLGHQAGWIGAAGSPSSYSTVLCPAAGVSGVDLPIQAYTDEGGQGKIPSTSYSDTLTVTFSPLATSTTPSQTCP